LKNIFFFLAIFCSSQFVFSQSDVSDADYIKTIIFRSSATNTYVPIIRLNEKLKLSFDDLSEDQQDYYYKVEHCNFDWTSSNLSKLEYVVGFSDERIRDYNNSFNTLLPYTNYQLTLPNEYTKFKISGNYILSVSNEDREIVFQRKFIIYESIVTVAVNAHKSRDIKNIDTHQTVQFTINTGGLRINNPNEEIKTVILQNNNWQTAITGLKPQFLEEISYCIYTTKRLVIGVAMNSYILTRKR